MMAAGCVAVADNSTRPRRAAPALFATQSRGGGAPRRSSGMYRDHNGRYVVQWTDEQGIRRTRRCPTRELADALRASKQREAWTIRNGLASRAEYQARDRGATSVRTALEDFAHHLEDRVEAGEITLKHSKNVRNAARLAADAVGAVTVGQITEARLSAYHIDLLQRGLSSSIVAAYVGSLRELTRYTLEGARRPRVKTELIRKKVVLEPVQVARLLEHPRRGDLYAVLVFTGLRWTEAAALRWSNLELGAATLTLRGKTKRTCTMPIPRFLAERLASRQRAVGSVRVFGPEPKRDTWLADLERCDLPRPIPKPSLRATFTNWLELAGVERGSRLRLRRDVGGVMERAYDDPIRLLEKDRQAIERMAGWYWARCTGAVRTGANHA